MKAQTQTWSVIHWFKFLYKFSIHHLPKKSEKLSMEWWLITKRLTPAGGALKTTTDFHLVHYRLSKTCNKSCNFLILISNLTRELLSKQLRSSANWASPHNIGNRYIIFCQELTFGFFLCEVWTLAKTVTCRVSTSIFCYTL